MALFQECLNLICRTILNNFHTFQLPVMSHSLLFPHFQLLQLSCTLLTGLKLFFFNLTNTPEFLFNARSVRADGNNMNTFSLSAHSRMTNK